MPKITFTTEGATGVERAQKALNAAMEEYERRAKAGLDPTEKLSRAAKKLAEQADPQKRYNNRMTELADAVKRGNLSMDDAIKLSGKYGERLERASIAGQKAFGPGMAANFSTLVAGIGAATGAVSIIQSVLRGAEDAADATAERIKASLDALGELQQIDDFAGNDEFVKRLRREGAAPNTMVAAKMAQDWDNSGLSPADQEFMLTLAKNRFVAPAASGEYAKGIMKSMNILKEKSFKDTAQKITQAAGTADATSQDVAIALSKTAAYATLAGFDANEGLAMIEIGDKGAANIDLVATQVKRLNAVIAKNGLKDGDFLSTINSIKKKAPTVKELGKLGIVDEALSGFLLFDEPSEQARFRRSRELVASAPARDVIGQRFNKMAADPKYGAALAAEAARGSREVYQEERYGERDSLYNMVRERAYAEDIRVGGDRLAEAGAWASYFMTPLVGRNAYLRSALDSERIRGTVGDGGMLSASEEADIASYLKRIADSNDRMSRAADDTPRGRQE